MSKKTEEKSLIAQENISPINKFINFIKRLFGKDKYSKQVSDFNYDEEEKNRDEIDQSKINNDESLRVASQQLNNSNVSSSFSESLKVDTREQDELASLQAKLESGKMKVEDLTDEQEDKLIALYTKQIAELEKQIEEKKKLIV